jgi:NADH-quinone oxidoreductase subunit N
MNLSLMSLEISVVALGIVVLLADLWLPAERKKMLGYAAAAVLAVMFLNSFSSNCSCASVGEAFGGMFVQDALSVFFKRFFLLAGALVMVLAVEFSDRIAAGVSE